MEGIPKGERVWVTITAKSGDVYLITAKENNRETYYLYKVKNNKVEKIAKNPNPLELEAKYIEQ